MNENDLNYFAGFFDGEGSICILKRQTRKTNWNPEYRLQVAIGQNDGATLDWIMNLFGGHLHQVKRDDSYYWIVSNRQAYTILKQVNPYLKYKKPQAELAIKFYEDSYLVRKNPIPKETLEKREQFSIEMKRLKKVFTKADLVSMKMIAGSTTKRADPKGM